LNVGKSLLYVQEVGMRVRDLIYKWEDGGYAGTDLTIMARHLLDGHYIQDWCYTESPDSIVWIARDDGVLLSLTYMREHQVWSWARHDMWANGMPGRVESMCSIREGQEDVAYMVVQRAVSGNADRFIERMNTRLFDDVRGAYFVDCGLQYNGVVTVPGDTNPATIWDLPQGLGFTVFQFNHSLAVGDVVEFNNMVGAEEYNETRCVCGKAPTIDGVGGAGPSSFAWLAYKEGTGEGQWLEENLIDFTGHTYQGYSVWGLATADLWGWIRKCEDTFTGLNHLDGDKIVVLADGNVIEDLVITNGVLVLPDPAGQVAAGLPYVSELRTLPLDLGVTKEGTVQTKKKKATHLNIRIEASRGLWAGNTAEDMKEIIDRRITLAEEMQACPVHTGDVAVTLYGQWTETAQVTIQAPHPLPATILAIMPDVSIGG
jgi:hypothetical protein